MSSDLRSKLVRLAHENPDLRAHLLPILREAGEEKSASMMALGMGIKVHALALLESIRTQDSNQIRSSLLFLVEGLVLLARRGLKDPALARLLDKVYAHLESGGQGYDTMGPPISSAVKMMPTIKL